MPCGGETETVATRDARVAELARLLEEGAIGQAPVGPFSKGKPKQKWDMEIHLLARPHVRGSGPAIQVPRRLAYAVTIGAVSVSSPPALSLQSKADTSLSTDDSVSFWACMLD